MRSRCYNLNDINYRKYGGRGITVCDRWLDNYDAFYEDMGECPDGLTLDRIETNGNYEINNCRWATYIEQANNRRTEFNTRVEYKGENLTISQWSRRLEISPETLANRLKNMPLDRAMTRGLLVDWRPGIHGRMSTYAGRSKCRCIECRKAASIYKKAAYERSKER